MKRVAIAVIEKDGKVLIGKRRKGLRLAGIWEFPGGKVKGLETPEECLKRELTEELEIEAEIGEFICSGSYLYETIPGELLAYRVMTFTGRIVMKDHEELKWVSVGELDDYDFPEGNRGIIAKLKGD